MIDQPQPPGVTTAVAAAPTLVVAPHFDDEVLGCGGLIVQLARAGAPVDILFLTDGSGGVEAIENRPAYARRRRTESEAVVRLLGCRNSVAADLRDGDLASARSEAAAAIHRALREHRPGLVLVPSPLEISADHRAAFAATFDAIREAAFDPEFRAGVERLEVWLYEVNHPGYPNRLIDVSDCREILERAMDLYASQEERHPYLRAGIGLRQFRTHTLTPEVELAEGYRRLVGGDFLREELPSLVAAVGGSVPQIPALLSETYREIERLNSQLREMEGTRAWRFHRWVERLRGRSQGATR